MTRPTAKKPLRACPECGVRFPVTDQRRLFCSQAHKRTWNNRQLSRAQPLMILLQAWRQGRHRKADPTAKQAFTDLCLAVDKANAEDRLAGRPPAIRLLENRYRRLGLG